jgi:hypothetical protein
VTENVNGKAVVQSDQPLLAYEFNTVPGYELRATVLPDCGGGISDGRPYHDSIPGQKSGWGIKSCMTFCYDR